MIRCELVWWARERQMRSCLELRILACQRLENRGHFLERGLAAFITDGPTFHLQPARVRVRAQFAATADNRRVKRAGSQNRIRRS